MPVDASRLRTLSSHISLFGRILPSPAGFDVARIGLRFKLLVLVVGVSLIGVIASSALVLTLQRQQLIDAAVAGTDDLSDVVRASLEHAMLHNDDVALMNMVGSMSGREAVESIRILDARGVVQNSSESEEVGQQLDYNRTECQFCHSKNPRPKNATAIVPVGQAGQGLLNVNVISNAPQCYGCHPARDRVLGILMIQVPMSHLDQQLADGFWRIVLAALGTVGLLVGGMTLALSRLVLKPIGALARGMHQVREGNLDCHVDIPARDELGELAQSYDAMRTQLKYSHANMQRREQETVGLLRLMTRISSSLEMQPVLDAIAEGAREIMAADIAAVGLIDDSGATVTVKACAGASTTLINGLTISVREAFGEKGPSPVRLLAVEEWVSNLPIPRVDELIQKEGIVSSLAVPLWSNGHLYGFVAVLTRQQRRFSEQERQLFIRLALQVVTAVENANLYRQVRYLATLEERDRLAREMHDNLAQVLGYMNVKTSLTDDMLSRSRVDEARASLAELKQITKEAYTDVRESIFSLRTPVSNGWGLVATLREHLAEYRLHYGIDAQLILQGDHVADFPPEVQVQINRVIQEALTNVRKHAGARRVWVRFEQDAESIRIAVEDDGHGFDLAALENTGTRHFGLEIMRERAESVGGKLEIYSHNGSGTHVVLRMPRHPVPVTQSDRG